MTVSDRAKNCCSFVVGRKHHDQADAFHVSGHQRSQDTILIRFCIVRSIQTVVTVRHPKDSDAALCMGSNIHTEQFFQLLLPFSSRRNAVTNDQSLLPFPATGQFRISGSNSFLCGIRCPSMICLFRCLRIFSMIRFYCHFRFFCKNGVCRILHSGSTFRYAAVTERLNLLIGKPGHVQHPHGHNKGSVIGTRQLHRKIQIILSTGIFINQIHLKRKRCFIQCSTRHTLCPIWNARFDDSNGYLSQLCVIRFYRFHPAKDKILPGSQTTQSYSAEHAPVFAAGHNSLCPRIRCVLFLKLTRKRNHFRKDRASICYIAQHFPCLV